MSRYLTFCLETKVPWCQTPSRKKKAIVIYNCDDRRLSAKDQLNAGVSKVCEIFKVCCIESL